MIVWSAVTRPGVPLVNALGQRTAYVRHIIRMVMLGRAGLRTAAGAHLVPYVNGNA